MFEDIFTDEQDEWAETAFETLIDDILSNKEKFKKEFLNAARQLSPNGGDNFSINYNLKVGLKKL
jgi:hypothetical protein